MKRTKNGIPYVESTDYREEFPEHMKLMAEAIDSLFDEVFRRIDEIEAVRCKDCKWYRPETEKRGLCILHDYSTRDPYWFCADGDRKQ